MTTATTNLVEQPISLPESSYPAKYFLSLKSTDHNKWKERWECMLWEPKENYSHLPFDDFPVSDINDRGKFFKLNDNDLHNPIKATEKEIEDSSIWVIPGALSTSKYGMSLTLQDIKKTFNQINPDIWHDKAMIFCPYSTGETRYKEAMEYNNNKKEYYSFSIEKFTRKYFIPKLIQEKKLSFITYSVGGKELAMIENAARHILLNEYHYPISLVKKLFQAVSAFSIGYATDVDQLPELSFRKITLLSASDQGLFIPKSLYKKIYTKVICNRPFTAFQIDQYETLVFLGHQSSLEILNGKLNHDGHRLSHYLKAMLKNTPNTIFKYLHSCVFGDNNSTKQLQSELEPLLIKL